MEVPTKLKGKELFKFLVENKDDIIYAKKSAVKYSEGFSAVQNKIDKDVIVGKADGIDEVSEIKVRAIINTTNLVDSHKDLHIPNIWKKSLDENKRIKYLQEHEMKFDKIIADGDDLDVSTQTYQWKDLGYDMEGETQALVFDATVKEDRNPFMFKQFKNNVVDNNSVGMVYQKIQLAINDKDYEEEYKVWEKYYDNVANKEVPDSDGYFFSVTEAKVIEGSAVPNGSNYITPVLEQAKQETEPTENELKNHAIKEWLDIKQ